jgi:hypothetical protein
MQSVENQTVKAITVFMDNRFFINCKFTDCKLVFAGGDTGWENTHFTNCLIQFQGSAQRTVGFLQQFNMMTVDTSKAVKQPSPNSAIN